jgi:hypothetical protein
MGWRKKESTTGQRDALRERARVIAWEHARDVTGTTAVTPFDPALDDGGRLGAALAMLSAVAELEAEIAAVKADAVTAAGAAGARHGHVADALGVTRQAVSHRWWPALRSRPGRPAAGTGRPHPDPGEAGRGHREFTDAQHRLRAALTGETDAHPDTAQVRALPPADGGLF